MNELLDDAKVKESSTINDKVLYDIVLVVLDNNPKIVDWVDKLNFIKFDYFIISKYDLNAPNFKRFKNFNYNNYNHWTYIYNNFPSRFYVTIGKNDIPENFDLLFVQELNNLYHYGIVETTDKDSISFLYNKISDKVNHYGIHYRIFMGNYLKYCLKHRSTKRFMSNLDYNKTDKNVKFKSFNYIGCYSNVNCLKDFFFPYFNRYIISTLSVIYTIGSLLFVVYNNYPIIEFVKSLVVLVPFLIYDIKFKKDYY